MDQSYAFIEECIKTCYNHMKGEFAEQGQASEKGHLAFERFQHCFTDLLRLNLSILPLSPCPDANERITNGAWTCRNAMLGDDTLSLHADALQSALEDN